MPAPPQSRTRVRLTPDPAPPDGAPTRHGRLRLGGAIAAIVFLAVVLAVVVVTLGDLLAPPRGENIHAPIWVPPGDPSPAATTPPWRPRHPTPERPTGTATAIAQRPEPARAGTGDARPDDGDSRGARSPSSRPGPARGRRAPDHRGSGNRSGPSSQPEALTEPERDPRPGAKVRPDDEPVAADVGHPATSGAPDPSRSGPGPTGSGSSGSGSSGSGEH